MNTHTVAPGECLASIAERYGFTNPRLIYDHPANEALRRARPDPNVLLAGDQVVVPDLKVRTLESVATEHRYRFVVAREPTWLRLRLQEAAGIPRSGLPYEVSYGQTTLHGVTDSDGRIEQEIPRDLTMATVSVGAGRSRETFQVGLGFVDPVTTDGGLRQRLGNLGFLLPLDGVPEATALRFAIHSFQLAAGLEATGNADGATRTKLLEMHGS